MNASRHQRGIIGWVMAVMLAGLALAMLTPFVMGKHKRSAEDTERAALEAARTAVVAYAMTHGKLPTPVPDTKDPKRCPNGIMPPDLGVNNWGRYGAANPFCLDTNTTLSPAGTSNPKALCAAARSELATASATLPLPRVFRDSAYTSSAPMAFVLYSTGNDHWSNLSQAPASAAARTYEHDFRGIDDSPGANHYDDQVVSYPLASLLAECGKVGGQGGVPVCQLQATPTPWNTLPVIPISLGSSSTLTGSCSNNPAVAAGCAVPYTWTNSDTTHSTTPTGTGGTVTPTAPGTYIYTFAACNAFGSSPAPAASATVIVTAPVCTLTPSPATITTTGGSSTLTLSCDVAPTAYSWSGGYGTAGCNGATCVVTPPATQSFGVTPTFGTAPNTWAPSSAVTATVAVLVVSDCTTPVCTPSALPTTITSGNSSTLSANCSVTPDAPLTYVWSPACSTSATCTVSPTTNTTYSVTATSGACSSVAAATTVTVGADTPASLPAGYVVQGGLTWTPNNIGAVTWGNVGTANWTTANEFCTNTSLNDQAGWRLPTKNELTSLYSSGAINGQGWASARTWSSTSPGAGSHEGVGLKDGYVGVYLDTSFAYLTCVR